MKLFISYGHDKNQTFVDRVRRDLIKAGHACWIDHEQIHKRDDWRRALMEALHDCDWTVGFLSAHALRPNSITPQELAIALDVKAGCLTTVLLEPADGFDIPVAVSHANWVDMSEWPSRQNDPAWYAEKLQRLLDLLSPALAGQYRDEITALRAWLRPVEQEEDYDKHLKGFVGREWLLKRLEDWRLGGTAAPLFWLTGQPGTGKSAFSVWITDMHHANVVALNLCRWSLRNRCDARDVVRTLAFFVARRVQDYRAVLVRDHRRMLDRAEKAKDNGLDPGLVLDRMDAPTLFHALLAHPLKHCFDGGRSTDRLLLVIDGLDEAIDNQGGSTIDSLMHLLREHRQDLPAWVGILVTSRPDQPAKSAFAGVPHLRIDASGEDNQDDLRVYARGWLRQPGSPDPDTEALIEAVVQRADGNFFYLRLLQDAIQNHGFSFAIDTLPHGLSDLFEQWFLRQFKDNAVYRRDVAPLLGLIVAAGSPVPQTVLDEAMAQDRDWDEVESARILASLGSLFESGTAPGRRSTRVCATG